MHGTCAPVTHFVAYALALIASLGSLLVLGELLRPNSVAKWQRASPIFFVVWKKGSILWYWQQRKWNQYTIVLSFEASVDVPFLFLIFHRVYHRKTLLESFQNSALMAYYRAELPKSFAHFPSFWLRNFCVRAIFRQSGIGLCRRQSSLHCLL